MSASNTSNGVCDPNAFKESLDAASEAFASAEVDPRLCDAVSEALSYDRVVVAFDEESRVYAEFASWPMMVAGVSVTLARAHVAQYFLAPFTRQDTFFIRFSSNPYSMQEAQLASTLRVMEYPSLTLSTKSAEEGDSSIVFTRGSGATSILRGVKNVSYAFTKAGRKVGASPRFDRVAENLLTPSRELSDYLADCSRETACRGYLTICAEGPLLTAARCAPLLNPSLRAASLSALVSKPPHTPVEVWASDVDNELVARLRFQTPQEVQLGVVHFTFDPLSAPLATVYAAARAGSFPTNSETKANRSTHLT
ncbi:MAG: hypothetical protein M1357_02210 [Candidatus Marsarchaeota archaeon]|nr:hypothetical protein [Candidatus Marsarchaeota archaeon]